MNIKLIIFSGLISTGLGVMIGLGFSEIARPQYRSSFYQNLKPKYALAGGVVGLLAGAGIEALRQLKKEADQAEALSNTQDDENRKVS